MAGDKGQCLSQFVNLEFAPTSNMLNAAMPILRRKGLILRHNDTKEKGLDPACPHRMFYL